MGILEGVAEDESSKADERERLSPTAADRGQKHSFGEFGSYVPQDILDVSFPVAVRGYDRRAVDAYRKRVNRVIAELKVRGSPQAAVRHALEQAEEKVQGLLQAAREAAEEIMASAQQEADESTARAKGEAAELIVNTSAEADRMKTESDELIANARVEADDTVAKARAEANQTLADANAEAQNTLAGYRKSLRRCGRGRRREGARSRLTPRRSGRNAASCSKTSAGWPAASSIWPTRRLPASSGASPLGRRKRCWSLRREMNARHGRSRRTSPARLRRRSGPSHGEVIRAANNCY